MTMGNHAKTLTQAHESQWQLNYLSITIMTLGIFLLKMSLIGWCTSKCVESNQSEEVRASRLPAQYGFCFMVVHMYLTIIMINVFMFSALWFTLFNSGPASWMESNYFHKNSNETVRE